MLLTTYICNIYIARTAHPSELNFLVSSYLRYVYLLYTYHSDRLSKVLFEPGRGFHAMPLKQSTTFGKQLYLLTNFSLDIFYLTIMKLKKAREFHILAPRGLR
jgi:hypothetical protein